MTIPLRYINAAYKDVPADIKSAFEKLRETRKGLYIHGPVGTGKTHIIWAMRKYLNELCESNLKNGISGPYSSLYNTTELLHKIRAEFGRNSNDDLLGEILENKSILFLDDIGAEKLSDWVLETFYLIINRRYEDMRPTIFTSNLPISDLAERIGDRTTSRIVEMCDIFKLDGSDRRLDRIKK